MPPRKRTVLTAADFIKGEPLEELEIPELPVDGKPGIVYIKALPAGEVLDFMELPEDKRAEESLHLVCKAVCDADGNRIFTDELVPQARDILGIRVFNRLAGKVMGTSTVGNASGDHTGDASPTA